MQVASTIQQQQKLQECKREQELGQQWASAYDCWVDAPGSSGPIVARPQRLADDRGTDAWPQAVRNLQFPIFALTASNPLGQEWPLERNRQANMRLEQDLNQLVVVVQEEEESPASQHERGCWWHSYGFGDSWREDGYAVSYKRSKVLELATKYQQGAIYEYVFCQDEPGVVIRKTVPVLLSKTVEADVRMITTKYENTLGEHSSTQDRW